MLIHNDIQLDFDDVLIAPQTTTINHRGEVDIVREYKHLDVSGIPIISANMTQTGTYAMAMVLLDYGMFATLHKFHIPKEIVSFIKRMKKEEIIYGGVDGCGCYEGNERNLFVTVGKRNWEEEFKKIEYIYKETGALVSVLLDVPNAYIPEIVDCVKQLRKFMDKQNFGGGLIAVGNVCSGDETQKLILAGANFVKVGIGPSPVCDTRIKTGCGRPQLSAIIECANAAHQVGGYIIADGGFKTNADFCKALVAGADMCMTGSMFAGSDEANGQIIEKCYRTNEYEMEWLWDDLTETAIKSNNPDKPKFEFKKFKEYYGMSSFRAQMENYGEKTKTGTSEGVECKLIPYTGPIIDTLNDIAGSLRSCGSYIGAKNIKSFSRQGMFYKVNRIK